MLDVFVRWPVLAFLVAGIFWWLARWARRRLVAAAAVLWFAYAVYELLVHARVLCSGECDIRVDLLAIYPLLAAVSIGALLLSVLGPRRRPTRGGDEPRSNDA